MAMKRLMKDGIEEKGDETGEISNGGKALFLGPKGRHAEGPKKVSF